MTLNKLKKITIGDVDYTVEWDKTHSGGSFNFGTKIINIGTSNGELRAFSVLLHEIQEIILENLNARYDSPHCSSDYLFSFHHDKFTTLNEQLAGILSKFIK